MSAPLRETIAGPWKKRTLANPEVLRRLDENMRLNAATYQAMTTQTLYSQEEDRMGLTQYIEDRNIGYRKPSAFPRMVAPILESAYYRAVHGPDDVDTKPISSILIHGAPRCGKTTLLSLFLGWMAGPHMVAPMPSVFLSSYSSAATRLLSTVAKRKSPWIPEEKIIPCGVGSCLTGIGANLILIEHPFQNKSEEDLPSHRRFVNDWLLDDAYTRLYPNGTLICFASLANGTQSLSGFAWDAVIDLNPGGY